MVPIKLINTRGDLFATTVSFALQMVIRLCSSLVLTRILRPEAYGLITILMSIVFIVGMLSDIGIAVSIVRDKRGDDQEFLNTAWTLRLARAVVNSIVVFTTAPLISALYNTPELTDPLRVFAAWFLIDGAESTSFATAIRRKNSKIIMYSELGAAFLSSAFTLIYCYLSQSYWGVVYGALLNRLILVGASHCFYREKRPKLQLDWTAARELSRYTKFVMPSSILTLVLSQFDRLVFLRLFDLSMLGVYGLASNISGPIESLISKVTQMVLYPRCAHDFRTDPRTFTSKYYTDNIKLFTSIIAIPAAVGGAAYLVVDVLYDPRYLAAAAIVQAFMLRATLLSFSSSAEDMLIAAGESHHVLVGNIFRAIWLVGGSLFGYRFSGIIGFTYGIASSGVPPLLYYFALQRRKNMLILKYELCKLALACVVAASAYFVSTELLHRWPQLHRKALSHTTALSPDIQTTQ